jgi:hypothetical protein
MSSPKLPQKLSMDQMTTRWAAILNPILSNPTLDSSLLQNIILTTGNNVINHKLGRPLQGWHPVRFHGSFAQLYDTQDTNQTPQLTLNLNASAGVTIDLVVF